MRLAEVRVTDVRGASPGARAGRVPESERSGLVVRVVTEDGISAEGEASPLPGYSPDTLAGAREALRGFDWEHAPEPDPALTAESMLSARELDRVASPAARFALETVMLHVLGVRCERPLWSLLPRDGAREPSPVPLSVFVGDAGDPEALARARSAVEQGVVAIKVKIGRDVPAELAALRAVRRAIGSAALRLDANQALDPATLVDDLERLVELDPECLEEPAPPAALATLARSPIPLALDESLQGPDTWARLAPRLADLRCVAVVLKPMALGGFSACLRWAARANAAGLAVTVSHLFDGPIALASSAHLALAIASRALGSGLAPHAGLAAWPPLAVPFVGANITPPTAPGLGIGALGEPP